jgi:hypothetical protein
MSSLTCHGVQMMFCVGFGLNSVTGRRFVNSE